VSTSEPAEARISTGRTRASAQPEWPAGLDVAALTAGGWRPTPFREFVLKIHSRCDLACDYCYMYVMADQSWRRRPRRMSRSTIDHAARRIAEHVRAHDLPWVRLILHGGEPLLAGGDRIAYAVRAVREAVRRAAGPAPGGGDRVRVSMQTNGVGLTDDLLELFARLRIRIGVSLDGEPAAHDRHRRHANGDGSHAQVGAALRRLCSARHRHLFGGLLCTIDVRNDPVATYEALLEFGPPAIDFLLPHGNWTTPPPGLVPGRAAGAAAPYADWLIAVFERWHGPAQETRIRLFEEITHLLLGGASAAEAVGLGPAVVAVIETDGSIEQSDSLKSAYPAAPETGGHVARDSFDAILLSPFIAARQIGAAGLCATCRSCPEQIFCGGGLYAHRYRAGHGFLNPSVYCADLFALIAHIRRSVESDIATFKNKAGVT
jgi:uncharacterized protein